MSDPVTQPSLLQRIRDPGDRRAWETFCEIYEPVIRRLATRHGMQNADADDLTQQVLVAVSSAIEGYEHDPDRAKFRTWLKTIARRAIINALTRRTSDRGQGGTDMLAILNQQPAPGEMTQTLTLDYRRETFGVAASIIREEFNESTWSAFWQTVVDGRSVDEVAEQMQRSRGSIYTARSRVMMRLKQKVQELEESGEQS